MVSARDNLFTFYTEMSISIKDFWFVWTKLHLLPSSIVSFSPSLRVGWSKVLSNDWTCFLLIEQRKDEEERLAGGIGII
jgi:hypothetical protein